MPPHKPPINERQRQERDKADQKHATARLHTRVVSRSGIDNERTDCCRGRDRENMFGGVGQTASLNVPIVPADDIKRLQNDCQDDAIDQNEFERSREKLIAPDVADDPIKEDPANDVVADIKQGYDPIVFENLC